MNNLSSFILTNRLKDYAKSIGFQDIGVSKANSLNKEAKDLERWLKSGYQGEMDYMNRNFDLRIDPRKLHENTKSIISLSYNYFKEENQEDDPEQIKISKYARGRDYHKVLKRKLKLPPLKEIFLFRFRIYKARKKLFIFCSLFLKCIYINN